MKALNDDGVELEIISRKEAKDKGLKLYFTGKPCKHGHVSVRNARGQCVGCLKQYREDNKEYYLEYNKQYNKQYYEDNKEYYLEYNKQYRADNKEYLSEYGKQYREDNKEAILEQQKQYRENNKETRAEKQMRYYKDNKEYILERDKQYRADNKEYLSEYGKQYYKDNKELKRQWKKQYHKNNPMHTFNRSSLQRIEQAKGKDRINRAEVELNYTQEQFKQRIEFQFKDGMSWDNRSEWHIDHKKPLSRFLEQGITDPAIINALSNLQPLWAKDNLSKGAKF